MNGFLLIALFTEMIVANARGGTSVPPPVFMNIVDYLPPRWPRPPAGGVDVESIAVQVPVHVPVPKFWFPIMEPAPRPMLRPFVLVRMV